MDKAQYFIEVDTYWQNSRSYFVGPFKSRNAATAWVDQDLADDANVWRSDSTCGGDIRSAWRIYPTPLTKTEAKKRGMRDTFDGIACQPNTLPITVQQSAAGFSDSMAYLNEVYL